MKIVLLGASGAGKGTQAEILRRRYGIPSISTGHILREAMRNETPVGLKAKVYVDDGKLVPDDIIIGIIRERLAQDDCKQGYILDGMPRTIPQAEALEANGIEIDTALALEIPDETIIERVAGRRVCKECSATYHVVYNPPKTEGICDSCAGELFVRKDDAIDTVKARLEIYHRETEPVKGFYESRGRLKVVHNHATVEETAQAVREALGL